MGSERIEYRPNKAVGVTFTGMFFVTSAILVWVGFVLGPDDVASIDGLNRILFTAVPIWLFSWTAAAVFASLAFLIARRSFRTAPTLSIAERGVTLPTGKLVPWSDVLSVEASESELALTIAKNVTGSANTRRWPALWTRRRVAGVDDGRVLVSSFALGADPAQVRQEIEMRREAARTLLMTCGQLRLAVEPSVLCCKKKTMPRVPSGSPALIGIHWGRGDRNWSGICVRHLVSWLLDLGCGYTVCQTRHQPPRVRERPS